MSEPTYGAPPSLQMSEEEREQYEARMNDFRHMKFVETEADLLASAKVPAYKAQALLNRGCPHRLVVRILL